MRSRSAARRVPRLRGPEPRVVLGQGRCCSASFCSHCRSNLPRDQAILRIHGVVLPPRPGDLVLRPLGRCHAPRPRPTPSPRYLGRSPDDLFASDEHRPVAGNATFGQTDRRGHSLSSHRGKAGSACGPPSAGGARCNSYSHCSPPSRSPRRPSRTAPRTSLSSAPSISIAANRGSSSSPTGPGRESSCSTWRRSGTACARPSARPA